MDVNYPFQGSYQIDEAFVTSRLETRTKEFVVYASKSIKKSKDEMKVIFSMYNAHLTSRYPTQVTRYLSQECEYKRQDPKGCDLYLTW